MPDMNLWLIRIFLTIYHLSRTDSQVRCAARTPKLCAGKAKPLPQTPCERQPSLSYDY